MLVIRLVYTSDKCGNIFLVYYSRADVRMEGSCGMGYLNNILN